MVFKLFGLLGMVAGGVVAAWLAKWMDAGHVALWWSAVGGCVVGCLAGIGIAAGVRKVYEKMYEGQWPSL